MSFRDDHEALRSYHDGLVRDLAGLETRAQELTGVEAERARVARELERVRANLEHHRARRQVRLDSLRVASPCHEAWENMVGDDRRRDCKRCEKPVFNISAMTADEAEDLLASNATLCVQFFRRADGKVMTSDCPVGLRKKRARLAVAAGVLAGAAGAAGMTAALMHTDHAVAPASVRIAGGEDVPDRMVQSEPAPPPRQPSIEMLGGAISTTRGAISAQSTWHLQPPTVHQGKRPSK